jgi:hypothetical protein
VTFGSEKQLFYGDDGDSDDNIGDHPVQLQRIPNYNNVTINAGVSVYPGETGRTDEPGGVLFIRVLDTITINGTLHATDKGGDGGFYPGDNQYGLGVGGGRPAANGQGGAYALQGDQGWSWGPNYHTYGDQEITNLHIGSGGSRGTGSSTTTINYGSAGGGAICVHATTLTIGGTGSILCNSLDGHSNGGGWPYGGGSGSGGSIKLIVGTYNQSGTLAATSGDTNGFSQGGGGKGSVGRIAVYAIDFNNTPSSDPVAYTAEATSPFYIAGSINKDAIIRAYDSGTGILVATTSGVGESYYITMPGLGPFDVMGRPHAESSGALVYKDIIPNQL